MLKNSTIFKALVLGSLVFSSTASIASEEKPVQHLKLEEITTADNAKSVFLKDTAKLKSKETLNEQALQEIHYITYSLEKSIAYYADNASGEVQAQAKEIAVVVEEIHLNSENNRAEKTKAHLDQYFKMAAGFEGLLK